jgi:hypothetical protein
MHCLTAVSSALPPASFSPQASSVSVFAEEPVSPPEVEECAVPASLLVEHCAVPEEASAAERQVHCDLARDDYSVAQEPVYSPVRARVDLPVADALQEHSAPDGYSAVPELAGCLAARRAE